MYYIMSIGTIEVSLVDCDTLELLVLYNDDFLDMCMIKGMLKSDFDREFLFRLEDGSIRNSIPRESRGKLIGVHEEYNYEFSNDYDAYIHGSELHISKLVSMEKSWRHYNYRYIGADTVIYCRDDAIFVYDKGLLYEIHWVVKIHGIYRDADSFLRISFDSEEYEDREEILHGDKIEIEDPDICIQVEKTTKFEVIRRMLL